jgi:hypothetical protein
MKVLSGGRDRARGRDRHDIGMRDEPPPERREPSWPRRLAGSRLVHFAVLGGLIFAITPRREADRHIAFDSTTFAALEAAQTQRLGRASLAPGDAENVRTRAVEDEILYREALRLGFDRADNVVRQRLIQKVPFLAEDLAGVSRAPTEAELQAFFEANRAQWAGPARVRLIHVYAGSGRRDWLAARRAEVIALERATPGEPPAVGDAFGLPRTVDATVDAVASQYGEPFATAVSALPAGSWSEPLPSKFGWHLVKVLERREAGPAAFEDVRGELPLLHLVARKQRAARGRAVSHHGRRRSGRRLAAEGPHGPRTHGGVRLTCAASSHRRVSSPSPLRMVTACARRTSS